MSALEILDDTTGVPLDRRALQRSLHRVGRRQRLLSLSLVAPLGAFTFVFFVVPILAFFAFSVANTEVPQGLPLTTEAMQKWDGDGLPPVEVFDALTNDLENTENRTAVIGAARRLNYDIAGFHGLITKTISGLGRETSGSAAPVESPLPEGFSIFGNNTTSSESTNAKPQTPVERLAGIDARWSQERYWKGIERGTWTVTPLYLLTALDLRIGDDGSIERVSPDHRIYLTLIARTFGVSASVTLIAFILGFPLALFIKRQPANRASLIMFLVLVPLWTSILVRTTAWLVLLQGEGLLNDLIVMLHLSETRLPLIHNRLGVLVAMVHICLPFMILPIYSVMKGIPPSYTRAAASLGAAPLRVFFKVYLPLVFPGLAAGVLLVFIMCLGFYVTPALVGGPRDQMLSYFIAMAVNRDLNWGLASALSIILIVIVALTLLVFKRFASATLAR
ncbi:ABC transporter permease [Rhizobium leguminosarum]|nr:ABC transporter permease [Rhizobium leguminosarum]MBY5856343.1 ABC transporter permease [Rhizobium leguminosarum]